MADVHELKGSLDAMGFPALALAFVCLSCYCLMLSGWLRPQARLYAGALAVLAAGGFTAVIDPWTNGIILMALGIVGIGAFVAAVWTLSALCGLMPRRQPRDEAVVAFERLVAGQAAPRGRGTPVHSA